jgi:hypothetical protein
LAKEVLMLLLMIEFIGTVAPGSAVLVVIYRRLIKGKAGLWVTQLGAPRPDATAIRADRRAGIAEETARLSLAGTWLSLAGTQQALEAARAQQQQDSQALSRQVASLSAYVVNQFEGPAGSTRGRARTALPGTRPPVIAGSAQDEEGQQR